jgi:hypothetical protein
MPPFGEIIKADAEIWKSSSANASDDRKDTAARKFSKQLHNWGCPDAT